MPWIRWTANDIARCVCCASPLALLGSTMAHGGQASVEAHKGGSAGNSLTKNGASGWLCRRPALPSAVGSIGIEPTADGPWRRLSGGGLGPWAHPSDTSRENGEHAATVPAGKSLSGDANLKSRQPSNRGKAERCTRVPNERQVGEFPHSDRGETHIQVARNPWLFVETQHQQTHRKFL